MRETYIFIAIMLFSVAILINQISHLSIGYNEAKILFYDSSFLHYYINFFISKFGQNDYALRIPMILLHTISMILFYQISKKYLSRSSDRLWLVAIYAMLPGINSSALIINCAGVVIVLTLLFAYLHLYYQRLSYALMPILVFVNPYFLFLFIATAIYGVMKRDRYYIVISTLAIATSIYFYGIDIGGVPQSRFIDTLALYATIFSPLLFLFIFYVLYRNLISRDWDLLWMIAIVSLVSSLLLSFRQKIDIQMFAPFLLLAVILAAARFSHSYHIRLKELRKKYKMLFILTIITLIINATIVFNSQYLYLFIKKPSHNFAHKMHNVQELATYLDKNNIRCVKTDKSELQLRLRFYGIDECADTVLSHTPSKNSKKVTIGYNNKPVYTTYVTKIHNK